MTDEPTVVYTAVDVAEANLIKNWLAERGIEVILWGDQLQGAAGEIPLGWAGAPRLVTSEEHAQEARAAVEEYLRQRKEHRGDRDVAIIDGGWPDWPLCPECNQKRQAICPVCESASDNFPLAEYLAPVELVRPLPIIGQPPSDATEQVEEQDADEQPVLLMCPQCDEAFEPRFYRHCAWCGHDFGFGVTIEAPQAKPRNRRADTLVAGLVLLAAAFFIYFWWLLRR